jgi:hypothetical protein
MDFENINKEIKNEFIKLFIKNQNFSILIQDI